MKYFCIFNRYLSLQVLILIKQKIIFFLSRCFGHRIYGPGIFFLFLFAFTSPAQENFILEKNISVRADFFSVDNLGNIYAVLGSQIQKYNPDGEPVFSYSDKIRGSITSIDVSNPMKILLFYKNNLQVVFLDNTLSQQGEPVELDKMGLQQASLVCSSINNGLWVYNQGNFQLVRLDKDLKIIAETGNILQQAGGELNPDKIIEKNNSIFLNDTTRGILVFDIFGTFQKTIPIKGCENIQASEDFLFFESRKKLFSFSLKTREQNELNLPLNGFQQVFTEGKNLFILTKNELKIYSVKRDY